MSFHKNYITFATDNEELFNTVKSTIESLAEKSDAEKTIRFGTSNEGKSFMAALSAMKSGKGARLPQWKPDVVIRAQFPDEHSEMTAPYLYADSRFGRVPWRETFIELFAESWEIVD